jgi:hypothetical protein
LDFVTITAAINVLIGYIGTNRDKESCVSFSTMREVPDRITNSRIEYMSTRDNTFFLIHQTKPIDTTSSKVGMSAIRI